MPGGGAKMVAKCSSVLTAVLLFAAKHLLKCFFLTKASIGGQ